MYHKTSQYRFRRKKGDSERKIKYTYRNSVQNLSAGSERNVVAAKAWAELHNFIVQECFHRNTGRMPQTISVRYRGKIMKKKKKYMLSKILLLCAVVCAVIAVWQFMPYLKNEAGLNKVKKTVILKDADVPEERQFDWDALKEINPDIIAWITVPGTDIDCPVLKCPSENYYLNHDYTGAYNSIGAVFIQPDASEDFSDQHTVIYAHNISQMFGTLHRYEDADFFHTYTKVYVYQPERTIQAGIYSTYDCIDTTETYIQSFETEDDWISWQKMTVENSYHTGNLGISAENRIITLSTCSNGREKMSRYVVHSVEK